VLDEASRRAREFLDSGPSTSCPNSPECVDEVVCERSSKKFAKKVEINTAIE
jgi:hypothetical protein